MTDESGVPKPTNARAWMLAFQRGFRRSFSVVEPAPPDLFGLLEVADLRGSGVDLLIPVQPNEKCE